MSAMEWALDGVLAAAITVVAWRALTVREHFQAIVLFITFGLLMALAWVRLSAPDVALAEAAIGAGLTGVLLLDALHYMGLFPGRRQTGETQVEKELSARWARLLAFLVLGGLGVVLLGVVFNLPREAGGLAGQVQGAMEKSGVEHPVTAVLLNFRAYDTWLELGVLLLALIGVLCARGETTLASGHSLSPKGQVLDWLVRWLTPVLVIVAGYLLWLGKTTSGGAFQAGVVLGAAGVLLWLSGEPVLERLPGILWRGLAALGFAAFLAVGLASVFTGRYFLEYPEGWAGALILWIECAAAVSIGCILAALFSAMHPPRQSQRSSGGQPKEGEE